MHKPTVGGEWSLEITTIRPFGIFLRVVGGRHSWAWAGKMTKRKNNKKSKRRVMVIGIPRDMDRIGIYCCASLPVRRPTRIIAGLSRLAGHDEEGLHLKTGIVGPEALDVVVLFHVDDFFRGDDRVDGHVVVAAILKDDEAPMDFIEEEVQGKIAEGHRGDGIDGIGIAAANEVAEFLVDDVNGLAVVVLG